MKILNVILIMLFFFIQLPVAEASTVEDDLKLQLVAIGNYLERQLSVSNTTLSTEEVRGVIINGVNWIVAAQEENGHFGYEYLPYEDEYLEDDNMVRQGGALYALSEVYKKQTVKDPSIANTIERSIAYFESHSDARDEDVENFLCIKNSSFTTSCDLGSTALALLGILNYVAALPEKTEQYNNLIEKYVTYLIKAKFPDRGFSNKYNTNSGFSKEESPFYNGEAMLTLVRYYQYKESDDVKKILQDSFEYLSAKEEYETPLYLWIMAALKDMQKLWPSDEYVEYAKDFTDFRLNQMQYRHNINHNYCAPVEGLASAYSILEGNGSADYLLRLNNELEFWLKKSTRLQLGDSDIYRVVKENNNLAIKKLPNSNLAKGGFLTGEDELTQRIDFTQHCVSTYLQKLTDIDGMSL